MSLFGDLVHENSFSSGLGNFTLAAVNGKQRFSAVFSLGGSNAFVYYISNRDAAEYEVGTGHLLDADTLVRDTVIRSSNSNNLVNFTAGEKDVCNDVLAADQAAVLDHLTDATDAHDASAVSFAPAGSIAATDVQAAIAELDADVVADIAALAAHIGDATDAHDASAVSFAPAGSIIATDVQAAITELDADVVADIAALAAHIGDATDAHDASAVSVLDSGGNYTATDVESALAEVMDALQAHEADSSAAHAASAISFSAHGSISATDVQAAIQEVRDEAQPLDSDLTSWAGVTRAAGFDTFAATPSSANLRSLLTDESGTGAAYFQGGDAGTPSALVLTNATGLVAAGVAASALVTAADTVAGNDNDTTWPTTAAVIDYAQPLDSDLTTIAGLTVTRGDLLIGSSAPAWTDLAIGSSGHVLRSNGTDPSWGFVAGTNIRFGSDAQGDVAYFNGTDWARLGAGSSGQFLKTQGAGANPIWDTPAGAGDVTGPGSSVDNTVPRFHSTTGKVIQTSGVVIDDSNNVTGVVALTASGLVTGTAFVPTSSSAPTNGMYLPASNTLGWAINSTGELGLIASALYPITNDGLALGTSSLGFADAYFASGAWLLFNNTYTIIHSTDLLTFSNNIAVSGSAAVGGVLESGVQFMVRGERIRLDSTSGSGAWAQFQLYGPNSVNSRAWRFLADTSGNYGVESISDDVTSSNRRFTLNRSGDAYFPGLNTTGSGANAFIDNGDSNKLLRSTSSLKYKTDIQPLSEDEAVKIVMGLRPIKYRSLAKADNNREFVGFGAEDVKDQRFVNLNADGEPDGVMYDRIGAVVGTTVLRKLLRECAALKVQLENRQT